MLPGSREVQASGPVKEDTVIGPKIAAVERRKARLPVTRQAGAVTGAQYNLRQSALRLPREANQPGASPETGQDGLTLRRHVPRGEERVRPIQTQPGSDDMSAIGRKVLAVFQRSKRLECGLETR